MKSVYTILLLICSNIFMTLAWYGHLKNLADRPWFIAALCSWGIAFFEYCLQVPANRMGFMGNGGPFNLMQLKILQEVITLTVFIAFSAIAFHMHLRWNHIAVAFFMILAVYFVFKG